MRFARKPKSRIFTNPHGQKELRTAGNPSRPVGRQSTGRHDTVDMGMMQQVLAPGVQHRQKADLRSQMPGIGSDLLQRLGHCPEQQTVADLLVLQSQWRKLFGEGTHHVTITARGAVPWPPLRATAPWLWPDTSDNA